MTDFTTTKISEAAILLEDALSRANEDDPHSPPVAMVYATHAVILAGDALCHHHRVPNPQET